ncbi:monofunctional biosynthetic peptidoglycan transglycosylase [Pseudomaricurvus sp.]|uniref:monofunctional biosynthetic peptidoglycan transglycosylase n=1 Tax=Pseudomaricurvus sp. TaxID=2004510 RepID=UPI003F6A698B
MINNRSRGAVGLMSRLFVSIFKTLWYLLVAFVVGTFGIVLCLKWVDPPGSAVIMTWELDAGRSAKHRWQPLEKISPQLQIAVIASEDQKFPEHFGFDFSSIKSALTENDGRLRGASTISQQVAKNLFLWNGRSYVRKALEAWYTLLMELLWTKQRILEMYLNIAEFGEGVYGAQAAAQVFFGNTALNLNARQSALLATVLPNPKVMLVARPSDYVNKRASDISRLVWQLGGTGYLIKLDEPQ